jgi:hypothetical protein
MSLHATQNPLISTERVRLVEWMRKPEFDLLRRILQSDAAWNEVEATKHFEKSIKNPRFSADGEKFLIKAMESEITLKKLEDMIKPEAEMFTVTIAPSPI